MIDRRYSDTGTVVEQADIDVQINDLLCGGCGNMSVAAVLSKYRLHGSRTWQSKRSVYCYECGRQTKQPLSIEQFPVGGWQAMADALAERPPTRAMGVIQGGKI